MSFVGALILNCAFRITPGRDSEQHRHLNGRTLARRLRAQDNLDHQTKAYDW